MAEMRDRLIMFCRCEDMVTMDSKRRRLEGQPIIVAKPRFSRMATRVICPRGLLLRWAFG